MSKSYSLGSDLRDFLRGLLDDEGREHSAGLEWGPRVTLAGLKDNYAPQKVKPFTATPGGIDNLGLHSTDNFIVPGMGEFVVDFSGYFRVARDHPTTNDWATCEVLVNIIDLKLVGQHKDLGKISVSLNPDYLSSGQIFPATVPGPKAPKACRIATSAIFELHQLGLTVFNKEPILLMNKSIKSIPPVDDPSGHALIFRVPLFDRADPTGKPKAYLDSLKYGADHYLTKSEVKAFRSLRP